MSLWLLAAERIATTPSSGVPVADPARCVARRPGGGACRACVDACPQAAIGLASRPRVDPDRCDACGVCAAACPTGALTATAVEAAIGVAVATPIAAGLAVRCERAEPAQGALTIPCAAALHPADLVALALAPGSPGRDLSVGHADCAACPRGPAAARIEPAAAAARAALAALGRPDLRISVRPVAEGRDRGAAGSVGRRAFLTLPAARLRRAAVDAARATESPRERIGRVGPVPSRRSRIGRIVEQPGRSAPLAGTLDVALGICRVEVGPGCDGCGLCTAACPHGAVTVLEGRAAAVPELCSACGACAVVCPQRAVRVVPLDAASAAAADGPRSETGLGSRQESAPAQRPGPGDGAALRLRSERADADMRAEALARLGRRAAGQAQ